jgi:hypothetical protein
MRVTWKQGTAWARPRPNDSVEAREIFSVGGLAHRKLYSNKLQFDYWDYALCGVKAFYTEALKKEAGLRMQGFPTILVMDEVQDAEQITCLMCLAKAK